MKHHSLFRQLAAAALLLCLAFSVLPLPARAAEVVYTRITDNTQLTDGQYVLVDGQGAALLAVDPEAGLLSLSWPVFTDGILTDPAGALWTLTVTESGVFLLDGSSTAAGEFPWSVSCDGGAFFFSAETEAGSLALIPAENAYQIGDGTPAAFSLYRREACQPEPEPQITEFSLTCLGTAAPGETLTFGTDPALEGVVYTICLDGGESLALEANTCTIPQGGAGEHSLEVSAHWRTISSTLSLSYLVEAPEEPEEPEPPAEAYISPMQNISQDIWIQTALEDIEETESVAITMERNGTVWALPNALTGSAPPAAVVFDVTDAEAVSDLSWNVVNDGNNNIAFHPAGDRENRLYVSGNKNTSLRIGTDTSCIWSLNDGVFQSNPPRIKYLSVSDTETVRWFSLGNPPGNAGPLTFWTLKTEEEPEEPDPPVTPDPPEEPEPPVCPIDPGTYVVWDAAAGLALSADGSAAAVTLTDGVLSGYTNAEIFTASVAGGHLSLSGISGAWLVETAEGGFTLKETTSGLYLALADDANSFVQRETAGIFTFTPAQPIEEPEPPNEPEPPVCPIVPGTYVVWDAAAGLALSADGSAAAVTLTDDVLSGYTNEEIFTASVADGQLSLSGISGAWLVETAEGGFTLKETTSGLYLALADDANSFVQRETAGIFTFTPAQPIEEPEPPNEPEPPVCPIVPGTYVVWDAAAGLALSADGSAAAVTLTDGVLSGFTNAEIFTASVADGQLSLSEISGAWLAETAEGGFTLKETTSGLYLALAADSQSFVQAETAGIFTFTPAQPIEEPEPPAEEPEPPKETVAAVTLSPMGGEIDTGKGAVTVTAATSTADAELYYARSADGITYGEYMRYEGGISLVPGFGSCFLRIYAAKEGMLDSPVTEAQFTELPPPGWGLYFGQFHGHSTLSDGTQTPDELYTQAAPVMDFLALTDQSNAFDGALSGTLSGDDTLVSQDFAAGRSAAQAASNRRFAAIYGYEMAWYDTLRLGHMATFGTPGFLSRSQEGYEDRETALGAYYDALTRIPGSISQFCHPGTTYGNFQAFGNYSTSRDGVIHLIELGTEDNATAYYDQALRAGWHVAPANNGGIHGDISASGRTVVYAQTLSEAAIFDAVRAHRVYATQDSDLSIRCSLNGSELGSILRRWELEDTVLLTVTVSDPTDGDAATVQVITEEGIVATRSGEGTLYFTLTPEQDWYYLRITQADGDWVVTAPFWVLQQTPAGIESFTAEDALPVQGEALTLSLSLYNHDAAPLTIQNITFTANGSPIQTISPTEPVTPGGTVTFTLPYTHQGLGSTQFRAVVSAELNGAALTFEKSLTLHYRAPEQISRILVDGAHGGNTENLTVLTGLAAEAQIDVTSAGTVTWDTLEDAQILLIPAPTAAFSEGFVEMTADYVQCGGTVILMGKSDAADGDIHTSTEINRLLNAMGATMRLRDDEARDDLHNGGQPHQLYLEQYNAGSPWCAGITENQVYRHISGATVDIGGGTWLIRGKATAYSFDSDGDSAQSRSADLVLLAAENVSAGTVFLGGSEFLGDAELAEPLNIWDAPYSNRPIFQNILGSREAELPLRTIREARMAAEGTVLRIRGYVTAGTSDPSNTFRDTLYLQDNTGGIAVVPFTDTGIEIGTPLDIVGYASEENGNPVLELISYEVLDGDTYRYVPETLSNETATDYASLGGSLVQIQGRVTSLIRRGSTGLAQLTLKDSAGVLATVYIEPNIYSGATGKNALAQTIRIGRTVRAMGILHRLADGTAVLRVRNCDEVVYVPPIPYTLTVKKSTGDNPNTGDAIGIPMALLLASAALLPCIKKRRK